MPLLTPASFRTESLNEVCRQLDLTDDEAPDTQLTAAIARLTNELNEYTNDLWEQEADTAYVLQGDDTTRLLLPRRCTSVSQVRVRDEAGTWTVQTSTLYRLKSSLYSSGSKRVPGEQWDWIEIIQANDGFTGYPSSHRSGWTWPTETGSVEVTGNWGWTTAPADIKRALALMVYHHFKPIRADLRLATRTTTADQITDFALTSPTGIPEADRLIETFTRHPIGVA